MLPFYRRLQLLRYLVSHIITTHAEGIWFLVVSLCCNC